ncbi:tetratricopeptide repeat protein [Actinoplanes sp. NPDC026619]|uniref:tetratricopeptide repeat protein n=1 Tax=Actinoplanes sp. NPDC026619 TaxID=3155798 RepID=UPI0033E1F5DC
MRWERYGIPGGVSTLLGVAVGALTNVATNGWSWSLTAGLVVLTGCWVAWEMRLRARDRRATVVEARTQVLTTVEPAAGGGVFDLLVAVRRVMPRQGRVAELDQLATWCDQEVPLAVTVLSGPAGVGKTRLALEFGLSLPTPWVAGWLAPDQGASAVRVIAAAGNPALILVDDADTRADLPGLLTAAATHDAEPRIRILLITRDGEALLAGLRPRVPDTARWLTRGQPVLTVAAFGGAGDRERWYALAVGRFAVQLGVRAPSPTALAGHVGENHETLLVLQARALLTALAAEPRRNTPVAEVIGELFAHEEAWWESSASAETWGVSSLGSQARQRCILAMALRGGSGEEAAVRVLRRVPELSDAPEVQVRNAARWVTHLYPALRLEPDLLGDWFIADRLIRQPDLATRLLTDLDQDERRHALQVLTRAASVFPGALPIVAQVWQTGGAEFADVAIDYATIHYTAKLDEHLATFIAGLEAPIAEMTRLDQKLAPAMLLRSRGAIAQRLVTLHRSRAAADPAARPGLAHALTEAGVRLSDLGHHREALAADTEAVALWRVVAVENPDYRPGLARALNSFGNSLADLGEYREAIEAIAEAAAQGRILATEDARRRPALAGVLINLGAYAAAIGDHRTAHEATSEAVDLFRASAAGSPDLALALCGLGQNLSALGEFRQALDVTAEAVDILQALPAGRQPDRARILVNFGARLADLGEHEQAHEVTAEAVALWRILAADNPAAFSDKLARGLNNLGIRLWTLGRQREALTTGREAVALLRVLAAKNAADQAEFASALGNLGNFLAHLDHHREAYERTAEAVRRYRDLAAADPVLRSDLARHLSNLGLRHSALKEHPEAQTAAAEAVSLLRALAAESPADQHHLPSALRNLAVVSCELGDHEGEFAHRREELLGYDALIDRDPDLYQELRRQAIERLRAAYVRHGRDDEAAALGITARRGV